MANKRYQQMNNYKGTNPSKNSNFFQIKTTKSRKNRVTFVKCSF